MYGFLAAETRTIIVDDDVSAWGNAIVKITQAAERRLVPIAVDSQNRNRTYPISINRQCILKPSFHQTDGVPA